MSNRIAVLQPKAVREELRSLVDRYHASLCADERRLHEAMLEYERSCWANQQARRAA